MNPHPSGGDPGTAAAIADLCAALHSEGLAEEKTRLAVSVAAGARLVDTRLAQIQATLDRIEARLGEVEHEIGVLTRPSWPF